MIRLKLAALALLLCVCVARGARAEPAVFVSSDQSAARETVILTGRDLTIADVVRIARHGAKVELSAAARQRAADAYGLLLQGAAEGVPIYWFNRGSGDQREVPIFSGSPVTPENKALLLARQLAAFKLGARLGYGPDIAEEEVVRAMMAVRLNTLSYEAASPDLVQALTDLLNAGVTPVVRSRGSVGEGDLIPMYNVAATMVGEGEAYYQGVRMPAEQALARARIRPLQPFAADEAALTSTNALSVAKAALLVADTEQLLDWADLVYAIDLLGMNSSITPLSWPAQASRPYPWLNWDARRVLETLRGSYLLEDDPKRIIQDPESLRASSQRQGAAWQAWATLSDTVAVAMNSSDHNPSVRPGLTPKDSWELATPQMMKFYVHGGALSHGQPGYILSNANWDPYPMANQVEGLTIALTNMAVVFVQRRERFTNPFFTGAKSADLLTPDLQRSAPVSYDAYTPSDLWQEMSGLAAPVPPTGLAIVANVEDLQSQTRLKLTRARQSVELGFDLLAQDLIMGAFWMDLRGIEDSRRRFGQAPSTAVAALRQVLPWRKPGMAPPERPAAAIVRDFMRTTPAERFLPAIPPPGSDRR